MLVTRVAAAWAVACFAMVARAQVVFDAASNAPAAVVSTASPVAVSWNHTVAPAKATYLVVSVALKLNGSAATVGSVTYGSESAGPAQPMVNLTAASNGAAARVELWGLANPAAGTHQISVSINNVGGQNIVAVGGAKSFSNVLDTVTGATVFATGTSSTPTTTATNTVFDAVVDAVAFDGNNTLTAGSGLSAFNVTNASPAFSGAGSYRTGTANVTMGWTATASHAWAAAAVPLRPMTPQIVFDSVASTTFSGSTPTISGSWFHTTNAATNRYLVVALNIDLSGTAGSVSSVVYGSELGGPNLAMSSLGFSAAGNTVRTELWGLKSPPSGTHQITATVSNGGASTHSVVAASESFSGVDQQTPAGAVAGSAVATSTPIVSTSSLPSDYLVDSVAFNANTALAPGASQNQRFQIATASPTTFTGTGSVSRGYQNTAMQWSAGTSASSAIAAVPLKPVAVAITVTPSSDLIDLGDTVTYTIRATNQTAATVNNVTITNAIPAGATFVSQTGCAGTGPVTCNIGSLASGASSAAITVTVLPASAGAITNTATVSWNGLAGANADSDTTFVQQDICATPGKDGAGGSLFGIRNDYWPGASSAAAGTTSLSLGARGAGAGSSIAAGDLLIVMQMQDSAIDTTNDETYGDGAGSTQKLARATGGAIAFDNAGRWEYVVATNSIGAAGGTLTFTAAGAGGGLLYGYAAQSFATTATQGQRTYQVIRVPQYTTASLSSALTASPWNGATGGVLAIDVMGTLSLNGATVSVNGLGFRGGGGRLLLGDATPGLLQTDFRTSAALTVNASKGEGIAGTPRFVYRHGATIGSPTIGNTPLDTGVEGYANGSYGRGAPATAGGGGTDGDPPNNDDNSGGGGGANGGDGGAGGNGWSCNCAVGGEAGAFASPNATRILLGGGGGAGTTNDGSAETCIAPPQCRVNVPGDWTETFGGSTNGYYSSGANGGGIIIIRALETSGSGTLTANGFDAPNTGRDGAGGGGAGGSIIVTTRGSSTPSLTISAKGGNGGNAWLTNVPIAGATGPGGGGGGGYVFVSWPGATVNVNGGSNGVTTSSNVPFGATAGRSGITQVESATLRLPGVDGAECAVANLSVTNSDAPDPVNAGSNITYAQVLTNNGPNAAAQVTFVTATSSSTTFQSIGVPAGWTCITPAVGGTGAITCTTPIMANGATASFSLVLKARTDAPAGSVTTNVATVSSLTADSNPADNSAEATTTIAASGVADVRLVVSAPSLIAASSALNYVQTLTNLGGAAAASASFSETIPANTKFAALTPPPGWTCITPAVGGTGTISCSTGGSIAAGSSVSLPLQVSVNAGVVAGTTITLSANASSATADPNTANNSAAASTVVIAAGSSDFAAAVSAIDPHPFASGSVRFSEVVTNNGLVAGGATFTENVPANTTFSSLSVPANWSCSTPAVGGTGAITCNTTASIAAGVSSTFVAIFVVNVNVAGGTTISLMGTTTASGTDSIAANNTATATAQVASRSSADLAITMRDMPDPIGQDQPLTYLITVTNRGPARAAGIVVTDSLPAGVSYQSHTISANGVCSGTTTVQCSISQLAPQSTATIAIVVKTTSTGILTNTATVSGDQTDSDATNNSATVTTTSLTGPVAVNDAASVLQNSANNAIAVLSNDTGALAIGAVSTAPLHGTATISGSNILYTPAGGYTGADTFKYTITDGGGNASTATVSITVLALPNLTIENASQSEGDSGTAPLTFTVTLTPASSNTVTVHYDTSDGTATTADSDYIAKSGTVTFSPGVTSQTIAIDINGDTKNEADETFTVTLSSPSNALIAQATATGTIANDDALPSLSIADASLTEGDSGTATMTLVVTLSAASGQQVSVQYATADGTASAGSDYTSATGSLIFPPGTLSQSIAVPILGDTLDEADEILTVNLSAPVNATIAAGTATGTIVDDDPMPSLSIDSHSQGEGNSGTTTMTFTVTLSQPSGRTVTVDYSSSDGTATAGGDYAAASGTLTFGPGVTTRTIAVDIAGDTADEGDETFTVALASPVNASIAAGMGSGTIVNDDAPLNVAQSFAPTSIPVGATTTLTFTFNNPNELTDLTGITFNDTLPAGLAVAAAPNTSNTCGGSFTPVPGATSISLAGGFRPAGSLPCSLTVDLTGTTAGTKNNSVAISTAERGVEGTSNASVNVVAPAQLGAQFTPTSIENGTASTLTLLVTNPAVNPVTLTGIGFSTTLPSGLSVATASSTPCGGSLVTTAPSDIAFSGGTVANGTPCQLDIVVTASAVGNYTVNTTVVTSSEGGAGDPASANLTVTVPCDYTLGSASIIAPAGGLSGSFTVTTRNDCAWTAISDAAWITTTSAGTGDGTVSYVVDANSLVAGRAGTITIGNHQFTITQSGVAATNLDAHATSTTSVDLSWNGGAVDHYEIWRNSGAGLEMLTTTTDPHYTDSTGVSAEHAYVYQVRAVDSSAQTSDFATDYANTFVFDDDPLTPDTPIKAVHVTQLRAAIASLRALTTAGVYTYTDDPATDGTIRLSDFTQTRDALDGARSALNLPFMSYSSIDAGDPIAASVVMQLRDRLR